MKSDRPLLVTESVTIVDPGYFLQHHCASSSLRKCARGGEGMEGNGWGAVKVGEEQMKGKGTGGACKRGEQG